jgi:hypothetical protein
MNVSDDWEIIGSGEAEAETGVPKRQQPEVSSAAYRQVRSDTDAEGGYRVLDQWT